MELIKRLKSISNPFLTGLFVLFLFFSVGYTACKKEAAPVSNDVCKTNPCSNGGSCFKGICTCIAGYSGSRCDVVWVDPYLGSWKIHEVIAVSTIDSLKGKERFYTWTIKKHQLASMFLIDNFMGNESYDGLTANIARDDRKQFSTSDKFHIESKSFGSGRSTISVLDGYGTISGNGNTISGLYAVAYYLDSITVTDTVGFEGEFVR